MSRIKQPSFMFQSVLLLACLSATTVNAYGRTSLVGGVRLVLPLTDVEVPALSAPYRTGDAIVMLAPTHNSDLCPFPLSRSLQTDHSDLDRASNPNGQQPSLPSSIAVLAKENQDNKCSLIDKARVADRYQKTLEPNLRFIIVQGVDDPNSEQGVRIPAGPFLRTSNTAQVPLFESLSFIFVNSTNWEVLSRQIAGHGNTTESSPFLGNDDAVGWDLRLEMEGNASFDVRKGPDSASIWWSLTIPGFFIVICLATFYWAPRESIEREISEVRETERPPRKTLMTQEQVWKLPELVYPDGAMSPSAQDSTPRNASDTTSHKIQADDDGSECSVPVTEGSCSSIDEEEALDSCRIMCSICILDYENGERLRMLPRCGHVFHTECISPWLTERQSCCPYCKTQVLALDDEGAGDHAEDSSTDRNSGESDHASLDDSPV